MPSLFFNTYESETEAGYGTAAGSLRKQLWADYDFFSGSENVLNFIQPRHFKFGSKTIGYTPWESTQIPASWHEPIKRVDDMWTTASWLKPYFEEIRGSEVFVLPHGIDECWTPIRHHRPEHRPFTFVHVGEPAVRKGGDIVLRAWHKAFSHNPDLKLIYKAKGHVANLNTIGLGGCDNIEIITSVYSREALWKLYALSDCLVYPTRGEGFGFIPLEAMSCGLPTICSLNHMGDDIYKYSHNLTKTQLVDSTDQEVHPGKWLEHNLEELISKMKYVIEHYDTCAHMSFQDASNLADEFSWEKVGSRARDRLTQVLN